MARNRLALCGAILGALCLRSAIVQGATPSIGRTDPDVEFATGAQSAAIPFEFAANHVYVRVRVNGSSSLWFLLDTGATASFLDTGRAAALGLVSHDGATVPVTLRLPGVALRLKSLRLMPFKFGSYDGHEVNGLLGYDFLRHFAVAIDYSRRSLSLRAPGAGPRANPGERIPLALLEDDSGGKVPLIEARIRQAGRPPIEGRFILDTGARLTLVLNTPYVRSHAMLEAVPRTIRMIVGGGGMVRDLKLPLGRVDLEVGPFSFPHALVGFAQDTTGILTATEFDGVIGGELLRRFHVVFDYSAQAVFLEPSAALTEPFEHDMSGMFLVRDDAGPRVHDLLEGSPASEAGLKVGDRILSIDGVRTRNLTLDRLRGRLRAPGRVVAVTAQRGSAVIRTKVRLRRLI